MKYTLLVLGILISCYLSFSQQRNVESENGYNTYFYPNGQISSEGFMVNGKPDGLWKSYFVDGTIKSIGKRKNALLDSVWVFYNEQGLVREKIYYNDGKKNGYYYSFDFFYNRNDSLVSFLASRELYLDNLKSGISEYYFRDGSIQLAVNYIKGKKNGFSREYNDKGVLSIIVEYRSGIEINREIINQFRDSLKHGLWQEFYPNGKLKKEENYIRGKLHGLVKDYDLSGELLKAFRYENNVLIDTSVNVENEMDIVEEFYNVRNENGDFIKKSSGGFIQGKPIGVHRTYDSLGRVNSSRLYDRNGVLIAKGVVNEEGDKLGEWTYYYPGTQIKSIGQYRDNRRIGLWRYYYENGSIEQEGIFKRGVPDDLWKWYFENGTLKREEYYKIGLEEGSSVEYDLEGNIIANGNYIEGLKSGKWKYDFDFHTETGEYKNGYKEGIWNYFYKNGNLYFEGEFSQGLENGKHLYYYKNGKLKEVQHFLYGKKVKNWEFYDYYGTLLKILTFENDILIKIDGISVETE